MSLLRFFVDFDGTITTSDVVDKILDRFASKEWKVTEQEWADGKIGSRECLKRQMALVKAEAHEMEALLQEVELDSGFLDFVRTCQRLSVPVTVVSDGFDLVIRTILDKAFATRPDILPIPIYSNHLTREGNKWIPSFTETATCIHACANCKPLIIRKHSHTGDKIVFVGDGLSDRFAAKASHLTFAKHKLLTFCAGAEIMHLPYKNFTDIEAWLCQTASLGLSPSHRTACVFN